MMCRPAKLPKALYLVLSIYGLALLIVLPILCQHWVYSPLFYDDDTKLMDYVRIATKRNDERYYAAQLYFAELEASDQFDNKKPSSKDNNYADIVYAIISQNREPKTGPKFNLGYLTQTLAALHKGTLDDNRLGEGKIIVCNIDEEPGKFSEVSYIQDYARIFQRYPDSKHDKDHVVWRSNPDNDLYDEFEKQKDDLIFCLEKALDYSPRFVLVLEDDTILKDDFVKHIYHHLYTTIPAMYKRGVIDNDDNWAYIKLYYPEKWRGYSNSPGTFMELAGIFIIGGSLAILVLALSARYLPLCMRNLGINYSISSQHRKNTRTLCMYFCLGGLCTLLVCYLIGRVYVVNALSCFPGYYTRLESPSPGCCTQAVLYQAKILPKLVKYLKQQNCHIDYAQDLAIDQFIKENKYLNFVVEPSLAVHIGMVSSVRAWAKNAAEYIYL